MLNALHVKTTVLDDGRIVLDVPAMTAGETVDVFVVAADAGPDDVSGDGGSLLELIDSFPPGPLLFDTWEEYEAHLEAEKDAWER